MRTKISAAGGQFWVSYIPGPAPIRDSIIVEYDGDLRLRVEDPALELRVLRLCAYDYLVHLDKETQP